MAPPSRDELRRAFRLHGFSLRPDASRHLETVLAPLGAGAAGGDAFEVEEWISRLATALQERGLPSAVVSKEVIVEVVKVSLEKALHVLPRPKVRYIRWPPFSPPFFSIFGRLFCAPFLLCPVCLPLLLVRPRGRPRPLLPPPSRHGGVGGVSLQLLVACLLAQCVLLSLPGVVALRGPPFLASPLIRPFPRPDPPAAGAWPRCHRRRRERPSPIASAGGDALLLRHCATLYGAAAAAPLACVRHQ